MTTKHYDNLLSSIGDLTSPDHFGRTLLTHILAKAVRSDGEGSVSFGARITVHPRASEALETFVSSACIGFVTPYGGLITVCPDSPDEHPK